MMSAGGAINLAFILYQADSPILTYLRNLDIYKYLQYENIPFYVYKYEADEKHGYEIFQYCLVCGYR